VFSRVLGEDPIQFAAQLVAVLHPRGVVAPRSSTGKYYVVQHFDESCELLVGSHGEQDESICGRHGP